MERRTFLRTIAVAGLAAALPRFARAAAEPLRALRGGVAVFTGRKGGSIATWLGANAAVVIDTQFPDSAAECLSALRARTERKLDAAVITHHHGDHVGGIGVFKPAVARVVAHRRVLELQRAQAKRRAEPEPVDVPETLFDDAYTLDLAGETVRGRHLGPAHTGGDTIWSFDKAGVVHVGDLVFQRMVPFIDPDGGGSIRGWIEVLDRAVKLYPEDAMYIFGHASEGNDVVGPRASLVEMRGYLSALLDHVRKGRAEQKSLESLAAIERVPGFPNHKPAWDGALRMNVEAAWKEIVG